MRSQTEMIGLVIVVVLLVIGALFYLRFGPLANKEPKRDVIGEISYAGNLLNAMLNVDVCDKTASLKGAIDACYKGEIFCGEDACNYLKNEIDKIMTAVGLKERKKYAFWIEKGEERKTFSDQCKTGSKADIKLATDENQVYQVNLQLC